LKKRGVRRKKRGIRGSRKFWAVTFTFVAIVVVAIAFSTMMSGRTQAPTRPKAGIIDGLLYYHNPSFVEEATSILGSSGFEVEYIGSEKVTVDLYKRLPSMGYNLLVLRVHCGPLIRRLPNGTVVPGDHAVLFTAESYDPNKYRSYQAKKQLAKARIIDRPEEEYFAVPPWFFDQCAEGRFQDTLIILDSCYGFYSLSLAEALIRRGAKVFIGWDGEVRANHTDAAVLTILRALCIENLTVQQSVQKAMEEVGPDPYSWSILYFYPPSTRDYTLSLIVHLKHRS